MAKLSIRCPDIPERIEALNALVVTIGRGSDCDLTLPDRSLSRCHCRLEREGDAYRLVDLDSANGTRVNGQRIKEPMALMTGDLIGIGESRILYVAATSDEAGPDDVEDGQTICLDAYADLAAEAAGAERPRPRYALQYSKGGSRRVLRLGDEPVSIGRHASCSLIFDDKSVSSCHARIQKEGTRYTIFDLGSTNGVKVNGRKVDSAPLQPGTRIRIGTVRLGFKEIVPRPPASGAGAASASTNNDE